MEEKRLVPGIGRTSIAPNIIAELSFKGGAHMCFVDALDIHASTKCK